MPRRRDIAELIHNANLAAKALVETAASLKEIAASLALLRRNTQDRRRP